MSSRSASVRRELGRERARELGAHERVELFEPGALLGEAEALGHPEPWNDRLEDRGQRRHELIDAFGKGRPDSGRRRGSAPRARTRSPTASVTASRPPNSRNTVLTLTPARAAIVSGRGSKPGSASASIIASRMRSRLRRERSRRPSMASTETGGGFSGGVSGLTTLRSCGIAARPERNNRKLYSR